MPNPPGPALKDDWTSTGSAGDHATAHNDIATHLNDLTLNDLVDMSSTGVTTGQGLLWSTAVSQFVPGNVGSTASVTSHSGLSGVTSDQHHDKIHSHSTAAQGGTVAHSVLTGIGSSDHHVWPPSLGILTDTTGTGAQMNTLVGGGNADALHTHTVAGTQATSDLTDWSTGTPTERALAIYSSTAAKWTFISTTALAGSTALPTTIVEGVTTNHVAHSEKLNTLFNLILGVST